MKRYGLPGGVGFVLLAAICGTAVAAARDDLQRAIDLYNARDYVQARSVLLKVDPAGLTDAQRAIRTDYLSRTQPRPAAPLSVDQVLSVTPSAGAARVPSASLSTAPPLVTYPSHWAQIVQRAKRYGASQRTEDEPTRLTRLKFGQVVREISFPTGTTFHGAMERIATESGMNIYVDWATLEQSGVSKDQEVSLPPLRSVTWRKVLDLLLQQVSASLGGAAQLDWAIDAGVLTVSTRDLLSTQLVLRVYDIGDLLVPRMVVPRGAGMQLGTGAGGLGTGGGTGTGTTGTGGISTGGLLGGAGTTP